MKPLRNILVHVDTRRDEQPMLDCAVKLAKDHQASLTLATVVPEFSWPVRLATTDYAKVRESIEQEKQAALGALADKLRQTGLTASTKVLSGKSSDQIIGEVVHGSHDLVLTASKGPSSSHPGNFGTTASRLIRFCPCPVWAFRESKTCGAGTTLVAVDANPSDEAHRNLNHELLQLGKALAGDPHVAHVWNVYGGDWVKDYMKPEDFEEIVAAGENEARQQLQELLASSTVSPSASHVHVLRGEPAQALIDFSSERDIDVLIIGTVGRSGLSGLLIGNTAETLMNKVGCSIVAVKPAGFQTPIRVAAS